MAGAPTAKRWITFDLFRLLFVVPIAMYHSWEHLVGEDFPSYPLNFSLYELYRQYIGTFFNYAALYVMSFSFFIWGVKDFRLRWPKLLVFGLGVIGLQLKDPENWLSISSWGWEIYGFLFIAVVICRFLPNRSWLNWLMVAYGVVMMSVPQNEWLPLAALTENPWRTILFAKIEGQDVTGWYLVPWLALPIAVYAAGRLIGARNPELKLTVRHGLIGFAGALVVAGLCHLLKPEPVPAMLGDRFYQFLFMQSPLHFWQHFLLFVAATGLALSLEGSFAKRFAKLAWLERLQWNKNFYLCYLLHFSWIVVLVDFRDWILAGPYRIDMVWVVVVVATELLMQQLMLSLKLYRIAFHWVVKKIS